MKFCRSVFALLFMYLDLCHMFLHIWHLEVQLTILLHAKAGMLIFVLQGPGVRLPLTCTFGGRRMFPFSASDLALFAGLRIGF